MSASFNLLLKTFLRRFSVEVVNCIRVDLKCEYGLENGLKIDSGVEVIMDVLNNVC